ncbi:hypothetical protein GSI_11891 [Ganoderma sinense ZZ0214-1]|uniref:F-box domain-containing protein n=1 Tax=Ganoderma sinense ZZ0214-1 TaxID=1077348 RepID=A0A2G8RX93_9APHY|nr:hypothetical protein GSI_11891 [Ganoderma sinense ZZ0214-1]
MRLTFLPSEILAEILIDLDRRDLLRCREVTVGFDTSQSFNNLIHLYFGIQICTKFKALIDEDVRAQYKVHLSVAGLQNGPPSTISTGGRLSTLRVYQHAWNEFVWSAKEDVSMSTDIADSWELYGNVLAQVEGMRTLHFKQIPSAIRGIKGTAWTIPDVGCNITEIGLDPAQDLLVIIEDFEDNTELTCRVHLHLRSLATGAPRPAAPATAMLTHEPEPGGYSYAIQVSEDNLGILLSSMDFGDPSELLIWNWKTGQLHLHIVGIGLHSWAFLTSRLLILAHSSEEDPRLLVVDLDSPQPSTPTMLSELDFLCAFCYPPFRDEVSVLDMLVRSNPAPTWRPSPALAVPFSVSPADRLFVVTFWLIEYDEEAVMLSLVPASTLLRAIATLAPGEMETARKRVFAWAEWGPRGSRLVEAPSSYTSTEVCYVYGTRFAHVEKDWDEGAGRLRKFVVVRDFNQLAVRRAGAAGTSGGKGSALGSSGVRMGDKEQSVRVVDAKTLGPPGVFQEEEVTTALPYVERICVLASEDGEFNAVMLTEDAMVLVAGTWQSPLRYRILSV